MNKNKFEKKFIFIICLIYSLIIVFKFEGSSVVLASDKIKDLDDRIDAIVGTENCDISVQIASAEKYDLLYEHDPQKKMIPASITKLITTATAINVLGMGYEFKTIIYTDDSDIKDSIVDGNIYLKGYGDPDLNSSDISYLAKLFAEKNIKEITGNIVCDESFLDNEYYSLANHYNADTHSREWPYVSAINLNKNTGNTDPAAMAGSLLSEELNSKNVKVGGIVISGTTPPAAKEIAEISHGLYDVISHMNKVSDNHSAITLFKVVGAKYDTPPGSLAKGQDAVINFLTSMGNPRSIFEILEGSGLSRYNIVNSDLYVRLLKYMYDDVKTFDYFYGSLAIAGKDGTLRNRMTGTEAENNVHAKTGTLNSVSSLTGYAVSRDSELIIFYIAMNGFGGSANSERLKQDQICEALCEFSRK